MVQKSPLGSNYGWVVSQDFHYVPRDLDENTHAALALSAVINDPELYKIQATLGYPVILRVLVGKYTLQVRVYNREDVESRPDRLASRLGEYDTATYMVFNPGGGLEILNGSLREKAQGHIPKYYADRRLSPNKIEALKGIEAQYKQNKPSVPLKPDEEWITFDDRESPSLEPVDETRHV